MEEKFRKAMVANAGLDNEKSQLTYQVRLHNLVIHTICGSDLMSYTFHFFRLSS